MIRNCCQLSGWPPTPPHSTPPSLKKRPCPFLPSSNNPEGIKTKVLKWEDRRPASSWRVHFTHECTSISCCWLFSEWGEWENWGGGGGSQLISLSFWGLLNSSSSQRSAEGIAKAPLCMRKTGLIQIFIHAERDVFIVFTFQKECCPFFSFWDCKINAFSPVWSLHRSWTRKILCMSELDISNNMA